jgi:hypothetical protein
VTDKVKLLYYLGRCAMRWLLPALIGGAVIMASSSEAVLRQRQSGGAISGVVVDSAGRPVREAIVGLGGSVAEIQHVADDKGRFVFEDLPPGRFVLTAKKVGFSESTLGQPGAGRTSNVRMRLVVEAGTWIGGLKLVLYRSGSVSGSVRDEKGVPIPFAPVRVLRRLWGFGNPRWSVVAWTKTDDSGEYRVGRLEEGTYTAAVPLPAMSVPRSLPINRTLRPAVSKTISEAIKGPWGNLLVGDVAPQVAGPGRYLVYPTHYYPGTPDFRLSESFAVAEGADLRSIDITLRPTAVSAFRGQLVGMANRAGITIRLFAEGAEGLGFGAETALTVSADEGHFMFPAVPRGTYTLIAGGSIAYYTDKLVEDDGRVVSLPGDNPLSLNGPGILLNGPEGYLISSSDRSAAGHRAAATVDVTEAVAAQPFQMTLMPGVRLAGRIEQVQRQAAPSGRVEIIAEPANGDPSQTFHRALMEKDGTFAIVGVQPGEYILSTPVMDLIGSVTCCAGQDVTSAPIRVGAVDLTDVTIRLTKITASLVGSVRADGISRGRVAVLISGDRQLWSNTGVTATPAWAVSVSQGGTYSFDRLRPGSYVVVAVERLGANWREPSALQRLVNAGARLNLAAGETHHNIDRVVR